MDEIREALRGDQSPIFARLSYVLREEEIRASIRTAYIRRSLVLKLVQSAALAIILAMYLQAVMVEPGYTVGVVMAVVSACILAAVWVVPLIQANASANRAVQGRFSYEMSFYDKAILIEESERSGVSILYDDTHLIDTREFFILLTGNGRGLYCIPKRAVEDITAITEHLYKRCEKVTRGSSARDR